MDSQVGELDMMSWGASSMENCHELVLFLGFGGELFYHEGSVDCHVYIYKLCPKMAL